MLKALYLLLKNFIIVWFKWNIVNIFKKVFLIFYNNFDMLNFNDIFLLIMIYFIMNQNNNILFLFWMMFMLIFIMINFYMNYSMSLISILTGFIFISGLLVFFMYSMLLFYNNFKYKKNNKYSFMFFSLLYIYMSSFCDYKMDMNLSLVLLDFNNWWIFIIITMTFLFLIFLCFSVAKEKYI